MVIQPRAATGDTRVVVAMSARVRSMMFPGPTFGRLSEIAEVDNGQLVTDFSDPAHADALAGAEVLFTGWGCPPIDAEALANMPHLKAIAHAAGSVKSYVTQACYDRGIVVSSAAAANALPVAEYTLATILLAGKRVLECAAAFRAARADVRPAELFPDMGNYRRTVGIVGASRIGRRVIELLQPFDMDVMVYDPYVSVDEAALLGARQVDLDTLARSSDVVSIHAPNLPETRHLFDARRLALLPDGCNLINTARGALIDTDALVGELGTGRIHAVLDVTDPEPLPSESPLWDLPNVLLTPHVAGSLGNELERMVDSAVTEVERYAKGLPFEHPVDPEELVRSA